MNGTNDTCGNCRHWTRHEKGKALGVRRRNPPTAIMIGSAPHPVMANRMVPVVDAFWPQVPEAQSCGEHQHAAKSYSDIDLSTLTEVSRA